MKLAIIANPIAGGGRAFRDLQRHVARWPHADWDVELLTTRGPADAGNLALQLLRNPPDVLAVCGGDGTLNEVATSVPAPPFPVAVLPAGTANVLARELGLPLNPVRALKIALGGTVRRIDVGSLGPGVRRRFLFVAGIGFDACAVLKVSPGLKSKFGMAAYVLAALDCLKHYPFPEFQVTAGDSVFSATSCFVCNAGSYGGGMVFCPEADMSDGLFDILVLEKRSRLSLACFLLMAWLRKPLTGAGIHRLRASSLKIGNTEGVWVQVDGELAGGLPLDISLAAASFPLVVPRDGRS